MAECPPPIVRREPALPRVSVTLPYAPGRWPRTLVVLGKKPLGVLM
jgi:hypothetical protein